MKILSILLQTKYRTTHNTDPNLVACTLAINIILRLVLKVIIILLRNSKEILVGVGWLESSFHGRVLLIVRHTMQLAPGTYYLG